MRGKLNEAQLDERAELHAQRMHTGNPSVTAIRKHWKDAYNIDISENSEYEWARNNQKRIDQKISLMVEKGLMPVVSVSDATITTHLQQGARNILDTLRKNKQTGNKICDDLNEMSDWYKMINAKDKESYYTASDEQRKEFDKRLDHVMKLRKSQIEAYKAVSNSTAEQGKVLIELMKAISDVNKNGTSFQSTLEKSVRDKIKELGLKQARTKELEEEEDVLAPVSDDERIN